MHESRRVRRRALRPAVGGRPLSEKRLELGTRRAESDALLEPSDHEQEVAAAILFHVRRIETKRQPDSNALVIDVESRRHDADDGAFHAVDENLCADDRPLGERAYPQLVREHDDERPVRSRLLLREYMPSRRCDTERREQVGRHDRRRDALRRFVGADVDGARVEGADVVERVVALSKLDELRAVDRKLIEPQLREPAADQNELARARIRQRPKQHAVDDAEDRGVGADAERQREHGDDREAGRARQSANRVARVLRELVQPLAAPHVARDFANGRDIAEVAARVATRVARRLAARDAVLHIHLEMRSNLGVQLGVSRAAALPPHGHTSSGAAGGSKSPATACVNCSQRDRSASSWVRPARVSVYSRTR